ncbi:MAG TPA: nuclear transport factor 2 family protein [Thermoanaerobaculia bacterium]|nr:nuclear transport factor 2 family protein [Thermoanaerobaculia bacterium]
MSEQNNITKIQEMYAAFFRGDVTTLLENVSDDVTWGTETVVSDIPWYPIRNGRAAVGDFFATLASHVDFEKFEPRLYAASGDQVFVQVDYDYRYKKNQKGANIRAVHQFTVKDGIVSSFRAYEDTAAARDAWTS